MASPMPFGRFPIEIQLQIFEDLYHACRLEHRRTTAYASVGKVWRTFFEAKHFERLVVTVSRVSQFGKNVVGNRRQLVKHIWLDIQFDPPMDPCRPPLCELYDEDKAFAYAVGTLFGSLSKWETGPRGVTLEIMTSRRPISKLSTYHRLLFDERRNLENLPHLSYPTLLANFPQVKVVTELQLRRNDYFHPNTDAFRQLLRSLPAVKKIEYEQRGILGLPRFIPARHEIACEFICENLPTSVTELVIFLEILDGFHPFHQLWSLPAMLNLNLNVACIEHPSLGLCVAKASRQLQHLSVSFAIDAKDFFRPFWPQLSTKSTEVAQDWAWSRLETLALTSQLLRHPTTPESDINHLLEAASLAVRRMPRLLTLELWCGNGNEHACLFRYSYDPIYRRASLTWKGTWATVITQRTASCWKETVRLRTGLEAAIQVEEMSFRPPLLTESVSLFLNLRDRVATNRAKAFTSAFQTHPTLRFL